MFIESCSKVHGAGPMAGVDRGDCGPLGPAVCKIRYRDFVEFLFQVFRCIESSTCCLEKLITKITHLYDAGVRKLAHHVGE
jgi:hypothetical protein